MTDPLDPNLCANAYATLFVSSLMCTPPIQLELTAIQAAALLANLQGVLQQPHANEPTAMIAATIAKKLQASLELQNPSLAPYLRAGWQEEAL